MTTFAATIRNRLRLLIEQAATTPTELSAKIINPTTGQPRAHTYLIRKLGGSSREDQMPVEVVDEVLTALGLPMERMLEPVLTDTDRRVLQWLQAVGSSTSTELRGIYANGEAVIRRLVLQDFIVATADGRITITERGRAI